MKKTALSLLVVATSGAYVWNQAGGIIADDLLAASRDISAFTGSVGRRNQTASAAVPPTEISSATDVIADKPSKKEDKARPTTSYLIAPPRSPPLFPVVSTQFYSTETPGRPEAPPLPASPAEPIPAVAAVPIPRPRPANRIEQPTGLLTHATMSFDFAAGYADGTYDGPAVDAYYGDVQVQAIIDGGRLARIKVLRYPSDRRTSVFINRQALPMLRDEVISAQTADVDIVSGATLTSKAFIRSLGAALRQAGS